MSQIKFKELMTSTVLAASLLLPNLANASQWNFQQDFQKSLEAVQKCEQIVDKQYQQKMKEYEDIYTKSVPKDQQAKMANLQTRMNALRGTTRSQLATECVKNGGHLKP